jgi:hypothetical protein
MSIKPNLAEDEIEVVIVATGFHNDNFGSPVVITNVPEEEPVVPEPVQSDEAAGKTVESEVEPEVMPKYRSAPAPVVRPSRNFAEVEECKRVPAYIAHGITLTTATKTHQVAGVVSEEPAENADMPALF